MRQVSQVPDEEVPEEAQRAGLAAGHRIQQGPQARARRMRCRTYLWMQPGSKIVLCLLVNLVAGHCVHRW